MRIAFLGGGPSNALPYELRKLGHDVLSNQRTDWYRAAMAHADPLEYARQAMAELKSFGPDVLCLNKGWHGWQADMGWWHVPTSFLSRAREMVKTSIYICYDDPAATPISVQLGIPQGFSHWFTTCPGIPQLFPAMWPRISAKIHRFWLAWDTRTSFRHVGNETEQEKVDLAITGSPYFRPFPQPHYQRGFAGPRRDLALEALEAGFSVAIYGPQEWLKRRTGGDPRLTSSYKGWVSPDHIHVVHRQARACLGTHLVEGPGYESGRFPWVLGAGGLLIHERRPGLREEFGDVAGWYPPGDCKAFLRTLGGILRDKPRQAKMRKEGRELVMARHTWAHRAQYLVEVARG